MDIHERLIIYLKNADGLDINFQKKVVYHRKQ